MLGIPMSPNCCSTNVFGSTSHERGVLDPSRSLSPSHTSVACGGDACHTVDKTVSIPDRLLFAEAAGMSQATAEASQQDRLIAWLCFGFRFQGVNLRPRFSNRKQQHYYTSSLVFHNLNTKLSIQFKKKTLKLWELLLWGIKNSYFFVHFRLACRLSPKMAASILFNFFFFLLLCYVLHLLFCCQIWNGMLFFTWLHRWRDILHSSLIFDGC